MDLILLSFKYLLNFIDMRQSSPWEAKSSYFFFSELLCGRMLPYLDLS